MGSNWLLFLGNNTQKHTEATQVRESDIENLSLAVKVICTETT
jgi:hypothetical protein